MLAARTARAPTSYHSPSHLHLWARNQLHKLPCACVTAWRCATQRKHKRRPERERGRGRGRGRRICFSCVVLVCRLWRKPVPLRALARNRQRHLRRVSFFSWLHSPKVSFSSLLLSPFLLLFPSPPPTITLSLLGPLRLSHALLLGVINRTNSDTPSWQNASAPSALLRHAAGCAL